MFLIPSDSGELKMQSGLFQKFRFFEMFQFAELDLHIRFCKTRRLIPALAQRVGEGGGGARCKKTGESIGFSGFFRYI